MIISSLLTLLLPSSCFVSVTYPAWDSAVALPFNVSFQITAVPDVASMMSSAVELWSRHGSIIFADSIEHRPRETVQLLVDVEGAIDPSYLLSQRRAMVLRIRAESDECASSIAIPIVTEPATPEKVGAAVAGYGGAPYVVYWDALWRKDFEVVRSHVEPPASFAAPSAVDRERDCAALPSYVAFAPSVQMELCTHARVFREFCHEARGVARPYALRHFVGVFRNATVNPHGHIFPAEVEPHGQPIVVQGNHYHRFSLDRLLDGKAVVEAGTVFNLAMVLPLPWTAGWPQPVSTPL